jgi:general secretion pathway protein A
MRMDRDATVKQTEQVGPTQGRFEDFVLPSRREAQGVLTSALLAQNGPVLLTGEPGVGKSWLFRRVLAKLPAHWRMAEVDVSPAVGPGDLYELILHGIGLVHHEGPGAARAAIEDFLGEADADGVRWGLIVEEAHCSSLEVLEELRILASRMGRSGSFAAILLIGQTVLGRRLGARSLASFEARLAARVHLAPLTVDELGTWLGLLDPRQPNAHSDLNVERVHRAVAGNPRRFLLLISRHAAPFAPRDDRNGARSRPGLAEEPREPKLVSPREQDWQLGTVAPVKPPLRLEEGMIEVGWDETSGAEPEFEELAEATAAFTTPAEGSRAPSGPVFPATAEVSEELVDDHYAALQAWTEWTRIQGRSPAEEPRIEAQTGPESATTDLEPGPDTAEKKAGTTPAPDDGHPSIWAEGQQAFAPYSQLFSKLRLSRDPQ